MRTSLRAFVASIVVVIVWGLVSTASAQLVVGNDQFRSSTTGVGEPPSIWLVDVSGASSPRLLVQGTTAGLGGVAEAWGLAADETNAKLYWNTGTMLRSADYTLSGQLSPSNVGAITLLGAGTQTTSSMTGLAFANGNLFGYKSTTTGTFPSGFYTIDPATATATVLAGVPSVDFGGFDYDPDTGAFYGLNDSTSTTTVPGGRGVYRIDNLLTGTPTFTKLADYPSGDTDIDGLAVGGGRLYLVNDGSGTTAPTDIYVFNLTTLMYEPSIPTPFTHTNALFSGGAWAPGLIPEPSSAALAAAVCATLCLRRRR